MITYPLSLGMHSTTDIVQAVNDLNARLAAIEPHGKPAQRDYDPAVSALCGITLHDPDGDQVGMSGDDARKIVAAIRAGQVPNVYHGDAIPDYTHDAMREIADLKAKLALAEFALRGLPNATDQPAGASPARAALPC